MFLSLEENHSCFLSLSKLFVNAEHDRRQSQADLCELKASLVYTVRPCLRLLIKNMASKIALQVRAFATKLERAQYLGSMW